MAIDVFPDDLDALRALVSKLSSERDAAIAESRRLTEQNDQLRHLLKQLQRGQFGQRSERLNRDQMQLALEDIETSLASRDAEEQEHQNGAADKPADQRKKRRINRGALPAHLPHVHVTLDLTVESSKSPNIQSKDLRLLAERMLVIAMRTSDSQPTPAEQKTRRRSNRYEARRALSCETVRRVCPIAMYDGNEFRASLFI